MDILTLSFIFEGVTAFSTLATLAVVATFLAVELNWMKKHH